MYKELICCDSCKQDARSKDSYEQHRALVDELEKTKEKLINIERKLQGKDFDCGHYPEHLPPPYSDVAFETPEGRKVYAHKAVLVSFEHLIRSSFWDCLVDLATGCNSKVHIT